MNNTEEKIREHLARVLKTRAFIDSAVLTNFLTFIVNETLGGRSHELKEYTIGINALKRDTDFNPQIDSIVRIHAGRLRRTLKEYYYENGENEEIEIVVPKGSYVPQFKEAKRHAATEEPEEKTKNHLRLTKNLHTGNKAVLAIFPFDDISETAAHSSFVKGLGVYLSARLTNDPSMIVISYYTSNHLLQKPTGIREAGSMLNASFILTGCVQADRHLRVHTFLNGCESGEQVWGMTFERKDIERLDLFLVQEEIVNMVISLIGGPRGVISVHSPTASLIPIEDAIHLCAEPKPAESVIATN
jgi:TolB-like protein